MFIWIQQDLYCLCKLCKILSQFLRNFSPVPKWKFIFLKCWPLSFFLPFLALTMMTNVFFSEKNYKRFSRTLYFTLGSKHYIKPVFKHIFPDTSRSAIPSTTTRRPGRPATTSSPFWPSQSVSTSQNFSSWKLSGKKLCPTPMRRFQMTIIYWYIVRILALECKHTLNWKK